MQGTHQRSLDAFRVSERGERPHGGDVPQSELHPVVRGGVSHPQWQVFPVRRAFPVGVRKRRAAEIEQSLAQPQVVINVRVGGIKSIDLAQIFPSYGVARTGQDGGPVGGAGNEGCPFLQVTKPAKWRIGVQS